MYGPWLFGEDKVRTFNKVIKVIKIGFYFISSPSQSNIRYNKI